MRSALTLLDDNDTIVIGANITLTDDLPSISASSTIMGGGFSSLARTNTAAWWSRRSAGGGDRAHQLSQSGDVRVRFK